MPRQGGRTAADKNWLHRETLIFEISFGHGDTKRQLVVPGKADKDDTERLFLLRKGQSERRQKKNQD
jgi:hypothetical protein